MDAERSPYRTTTVKAGTFNTVRMAFKPQLARSPWATAARPADVLVPERFPDLGQQAVGAGPTLDYANTPAFFAELQSVIGAGLKRTRH